MSTATAELPRMKYAQAATQAWSDWKAAGQEPKIEVVKRRLEAEFGKSRIGETYGYTEKNGQLDSAVSMLYWDVVENGKGLLDYDEQDGFIKNLLTQARNILSAYNRATVKMVTSTGSTRTVSVPQYVSVRGQGSKPLVDMSVQDRNNVAEEFIRDAKTALYRWHTIQGTDWPYIRRVLVRLCKELRAEWKKIS